MRGVHEQKFDQGVNFDVLTPCSPMSLDENPTEKGLLAPLVPDELAAWAEWQTDEEDEETTKQQQSTSTCSEGHCPKIDNGRSKYPYIPSETIVDPITCDGPLPQVHVPKCKRPTKMELLTNIAKHPFRNVANGTEAFQMESLPTNTDKHEQKLAIVYPRPRASQQPTSPWKWRSDEFLSHQTRKPLISERSSPREKGHSSGGSRWYSDDVLLPHHERRTHDSFRTPVNGRDLVAEISSNDQSIALRLLDRDSAETGVTNAEQADYMHAEQQHFLYANTCAFTSVSSKAQLGNGKQTVGDHYLDPAWNTRPVQEKSDTPLLSQDALVIEGGCSAFSHRCWRCCCEKAEYCHALCLNCPGFWSIFFLIIDIPCAFCFC